MKRISLLLIVLTLLWAPVRAQEPDLDELTDLIELGQTIKGLIPYYDKENHMSLVGVNLNHDGRFLRIEYAMEKGYDVKEADWYLDYLCHNELWDVSPLLYHQYDLRMLIKLPVAEKINGGSAAFNFTPEDIRNSLAPSLEEQARTFVASLARHINSRLPHQVGENEVMAKCMYDGVKNAMTTVYLYPDGYWPEVKQYVQENMDLVRKDRAYDLVRDTANHLAFSAYKGEVTLRHVYMNEKQTDSVVMVIEPWMWNTVFERGLGNTGNHMDQVQIIANDVDGQCPLQVDAQTKLVSCKLDREARRLTYTYSLTEAAMSNLRGSEQQRQALEEAILHTYTTTEGSRLATHLVKAGVEAVYLYASPYGGDSIRVIVTVDELKKLLSNQQ